MPRSLPLSDSNRNDEPAAEDYVDLYENAPCGYLSIQPDGRIFKANTTFSKWLGFSSQALIGKPVQDLLNVPSRIFYETHFAPLLRMQGFFNEVALDLLTQEGIRLPVLVNATERRDAAGRHLSTRLTVFNATDRRRYERDLVEARAAAEAAEQKLRLSLHDERETAALREQFIAVLGHDLRNPLAAISSGATLLRRMPLGERAGVIAALIHDSAQRMAGIIDNVLDFARGRLGGGITLERTIDDQLEPMLCQVIAELQASVPAHVIEVSFDLKEPVRVDRQRLGQLFSNLLGNALTHGIEGKPVRVSARSGNGSFELSVSNASTPIPPEALENVFQPFFRGSIRPSQQGLGLGLYIASEIAKAHGGKIDVDSTPAETRFTFRMPVT